ncbi:hypothetical protein CPT_Metamorpho_183 [Klebsiella phage Metamorpho]|nr:hypothetical protein CPT_Metamorpho_183 [Klebsiella phage Metamorpho]
MTKDEKVILHNLIRELVLANRNEVWEESRWDSSKQERRFAQEEVQEAEVDLNAFIARLK